VQAFNIWEARFAGSLSHGARKRNHRSAYITKTYTYKLLQKYQMHHHFLPKHGFMRT